MTLRTDLLNDLNTGGCTHGPQRIIKHNCGRCVTDAIEKYTAEIRRCLAHVKCPHCDLYFSAKPCDLVDHLEAHAALNAVL